MVEIADADDDGIVRTVSVAFRPRNKRDTGRPYTTKAAQRLKIGVQRFAVLMPVEETSGHVEGSDMDQEPSAPPPSEMT